MATEKVEALVDGGKATAGPPIGPALGPLGVNIGQVISDINKKTESFKGMQVPVTIAVDTDSKDYTITIGTPPASALIKKEAGVEKGASDIKSEQVSDLKIEQVIKIAKMKEESLLGKNNKSKVKEIVGTCNSMGILVEGFPATEALKEINAGKFDKEIESGKTEISADEMKELEEEKKRLAHEVEEKRAEYEAQAKKVLEEMKDHAPREIKKKMEEEGIPHPIIEEIAPKEEAK